LFLNPGSVGLPLGSVEPTVGDVPLPTRAENALLTVEGSGVEVCFQRLAIDVDALAEATAAMSHSTWAGDLERRIVRWKARAVASPS
jgi:hypothetical protein